MMLPRVDLSFHAHHRRAYSGLGARVVYGKIALLVTLDHPINITTVFMEIAKYWNILRMWKIPKRESDVCT